MTHSNRPTLRRITAVLSLVGLATIGAACGGNDPSASTTTAPAGSATTAAGTTTPPSLTNAPTSTAPAAVKGGTLTVGLDAESPGFNPTADPWANGGHNVARAIFDPLATYDAGGKVVPYLAESITANTDATVWTIKVRSGVTFHDGEPLNAEAVRLNFAAVQASAKYKGQLALLASMKVVDDLTLELTMSKPWSTFPNSLVGNIGSQVGYIAAPKMLASADGGRHPIGTGPFKFVEWVPDDHLTVERNDAYWQQPAWLDTIIFKPIPDPTARKAAMDAGDIDLYYTGNTSEITEYQKLQKDGKFNVTIGAPSEPDCIMFNTKSAPLDDVRVRRAIVMATDMSRIFDYLDATGVKRLTHGPYADTSFWYTKNNYPEFDLAGAKQLIADYTKEKGKPVSIEFAGGQSPFIVALQELYQSMWKDAGIDVKIVSRAQAENISAVVGGKFQVILWGGIGGGDPDDDYNDFHSGTGLNFSQFNTPEMDAALDKGRTLTDPEARKAQYAIVQQILGDNVPYLWAGTNQFGVITKPNVEAAGSFVLPDKTEGQAITGGELFLKDIWLKQ